jgi:hypothetical protein
MTITVTGENLLDILRQIGRSVDKDAELTEQETSPPGARRGRPPKNAVVPPVEDVVPEPVAQPMQQIASPLIPPTIDGSAPAVVVAPKDNDARKALLALREAYVKAGKENDGMAECVKIIEKYGFKSVSGVTVDKVPLIAADANAKINELAMA